jgi:O-antigen/teichoic acid export membrane protein
MSFPVAPEQPRQGLRLKTLSGLRWSFSSTALSTLIQIVHMVIMARLLVPEDFGLVALASAFLRFGVYFAQMGIGHALMQRLTLTEREIRTAFTSSVLLGLLLAAVFYLIAPFAESIAHAPEVVPVIQVLALSMVITGLGTTALSLLKRELRFRELAVIEVGSFVVGYVLVGITLAVLGFGVWSLVFAALCQATLQTFAALVMSQHASRPLLAWTEVKALYGYGAKFSATQLLFVMRHALITASVGRFAGVAVLGLFDRARLLVQLPFEKLETTVTKVLFPAMSRVQKDRELLKRLYLLQKGLVAALFLPTLAGMAVSADVIIAVLLGPQWAGAATIVPLLALAVGLIFLGQFARVVADLKALLNQRLVIEMVHLALLASALLIGARYGLNGLLAGIVVAEAYAYFAYVQLMGRQLDVAWGEYFQFALPGLLATGLVGVVLIVTQAFLHVVEFPPIALLLTQVVVGTALLIIAWRSPLFSFLRSQVMLLVIGRGDHDRNPTSYGWRPLVGLLLGRE